MKPWRTPGASSRAPDQVIFSQGSQWLNLRKWVTESQEGCTFSARPQESGHVNAPVWHSCQDEATHLQVGGAPLTSCTEGIMFSGAHVYCRVEGQGICKLKAHLWSFWEELLRDSTLQMLLTSQTDICASDSARPCSSGKGQWSQTSQSNHISKCRDSPPPIPSPVENVTSSTCASWECKMVT